MSDELFERGKGIGPVLAARQLAAIAQETRLTLMTLLAAGGPQSVSELTGVCGATFATVSHHLQILLAAQLVEVAQDGRSNVYRITPDVLLEPPLSNYLGGFRFAGLDVLLLSPESEPEPEPEPEPVKPTKRTRKGVK